MTFEKIKRYYETGLWSKSLVKMAVRKGIITEGQYHDIVVE